MTDQPTTFNIPGAPPELMDVINTHRALFGGFRMEGEEGTEGGLPDPNGQPPEGGELQKESPAGEGGSRDIAGQPKWVQDLVNGLRKEAGDSRVNAKQQAAEEARQEMAQEIGKALGLVKGTEEIDPKQLATQVQAAQAETADVRRELAVYRQAGKAGADPDALLDSNSFMRSIASVDPTDDAKITAAITEAVKNNSKLSAGPRAGTKSGTDTGGTGERATTKEAFDKMSGAERNALYISNPDLYARLSNTN